MRPCQRTSMKNCWSYEKCKISRLVARGWSFPMVMQSPHETVICRLPFNQVLLVGGGGGESAPPASFSALYGKRLKMGTWNFLTFPKHSLGMLCQIFEFLLCAEAPPGPLSPGHVCQVSANCFWKFSKAKNLIMCDGLVYWETCPEIWPKSFKKQQSYNISKHLVKKTAIVIFGPLNPKFADFWDFRKQILKFTMREMEWRLPHRNRPYGSRDLRGGGGESPPPFPHQLTSSRKPTSNRVKVHSATSPIQSDEQCRSVAKSVLRLVSSVGKTSVRGREDTGSITGVPSWLTRCGVGSRKLP